MNVCMRETQQEERKQCGTFHFSWNYCGEDAIDLQYTFRQRFCFGQNEHRHNTRRQFRVGSRQRGMSALLYAATWYTFGNLLRTSWLHGVCHISHPLVSSWYFSLYSVLHKAVCSVLSMAPSDFEQWLIVAAVLTLSNSSSPYNSTLQKSSWSQDRLQWLWSGSKKAKQDNNPIYLGWFRCLVSSRSQYVLHAFVYGIIKYQVVVSYRWIYIRVVVEKIGSIHERKPFTVRNLISTLVPVPSGCRVVSLFQYMISAHILRTSNYPIQTATRIVCTLRRLCRKTCCGVWPHVMSNTINSITAW